MLLTASLFIVNPLNTKKRLFVRAFLDSGLRLVPSKLGTLIGGSVDDIRYPDTTTGVAAVPMCFKTDVKLSVTAMSLFFKPDPPLDLTPNLEDFWSFETLGIRDSPYVNDDDVALSKFNSRIEFRDGRYFLAWPWIEDIPPLPDNRTLTFSRFVSTMRKYDADTALLTACDDVIKQQLGQEVIEEVPDEGVVVGPLHYLPHHAVVTPGKTTKTRIVYDASARSKKENHSLNDCLYRGPILVPDLGGVLLRFRLPKIGIISDISKAFLQMALHLDQRDCTRFFWVHDINKRPLTHPDNIKVYRFTRVLFGSKASPSMLKLTVDHHLSRYRTELSELIRRNIYVDNLITGVDGAEEALELYKAGKKMFNDASMNLREWNTNNEEVLSQIPQSD
ncbi:MAG: hypothetical protein GY696_16460 [Gammaproteobacteria bacterium]|nr:hypothetical protein [Gammaproteobacteria bacterium]